MFQQPTVLYPGPNHSQRQQQRTTPPSPHFPTGPDERGNWEQRWRRRTTYDAQGKVLGTVVEEDATFTPPHLLQLQPPRRQQAGKGFLWLLVLFLLAPAAFPLIIIGLMVISVVLAVLQKVLLIVIIVVISLLVLLLLFRLARKP